MKSAKLLLFLLCFLAVPGAHAARSFNGSSQGVGATGVAYGGTAKLSQVAWVWINSYAGGDHLMMEQANQTNYLIDVFGDGKIYYADTCSGLDQKHYTGPSTGAWHSFIFETDLSQASGSKVGPMYVDGVSQTLTTDSSTSTCTSWVDDTTAYTPTLMARGTGATSLQLGGKMAEVAFYDVLLTAGEALALAKGAPPSVIRPGHLLAYFPLHGNVDPEPRLGRYTTNGHLNAPLAGSPPKVDHCPCGIASHGH